MDHGEILVMERETVQGRGRRPRKSNLSALRGQGRPGHGEDAYQRHRLPCSCRRRVHAASQPYDHTLAARGRERTVGLTTIDCLGTAEESTIGAEQIPEVGSHVCNFEGQNSMRVTTPEEIRG
jgi:hypothetical protein